MSRALFVFLSVLLISGCVSLPDVYLVDRHTVMESEASGEWPELETRFLDDALSAGPTPFAKDKKEKMSDAHRLLNAELSAGSMD